MGADWYRNTFSGYEPNLPDIPALPAVPAAAAPGWTRTNPLNRVLPSVIACPPNAVCERQKVVRCSPDHIEEKTFLQKALPADVLPFPLNQPACVLDTRKIDADRKRSRVVSWIAERAEKAAREHRGRVACGEARPASTGSGMPEREAWEAVKMAAGSGKAGSDAVSPSELEAAWENFGAVLRAQPAADGGDEGKIYFPRLSYDNGTIATSSAPIESWGCWARRIGYRVLALVAVLLGLSWFLSSFRSQRKRAEEERELVVDLQQAVINVLRGSEGAVSINQLRDYYITHVAPPRSRRGQGPFPQHDDGRYYVGSVQDVRRIWLKVRKDVEHNANVRVIDVMVAGEPHESWEWIGPRGTGTLLSAPTSPASPPPQNGYGAGQGYGVAEEPNHDAVPVPVPAQAETPRNWWYGEKRPVV
ncbi:Man1-Src1p-C-terminal domain-containing protein [Hyaloraphidium curvatum]|nr:Man1-Src1p-C-terminal domain-containing protein [Hyaloraphidium curvatum]